MYQPAPSHLSFDEALAHLTRRFAFPIVRGPVDAESPAAVARTLRQAHTEGLDIRAFRIDPQRYEKFCSAAGYTERYSYYYPDNLPEKTFEHFIALELLHLNKNNVLIDVASEHSPLAEIVTRLIGASAYSQDIMYPLGVHDRRIGGDACQMPIADRFATHAVLTCSLEHFERDADTRLFFELRRVLVPGGRVCVVPFYMADAAATQTDPVVSAAVSDICFDEGTTLYCAPGWGNRHGRFYSPGSFCARLVAPLRGIFRFEVFHLANANQLHPSIYARFAFTATLLEQH